MTYLTAATRAAVEGQQMEYLTTHDLDELYILLNMRINSLKDRASTLHAFERQELALYREINERLIMEIKAAHEERVN